MADQVNTSASLSESDDFMAMRLYKFAQMSAQDMKDKDAGEGDADEVEVSFEQLKETVAWCLENGRDDIIDLAIDLATFDNDNDAIAEIEVACEYESTTALIRSNDGIESTKVTLFAIPILVNLASGPCPDHLPLSPVFHEIVKSIREYDIVDETPDIHVVNYLYSISQLHRLEYSDIYRLTCNVINCASDPAADEASLLYQAEVDHSDEIEAKVALRFLIGVMAVPGSDEGGLADEEQESDEIRGAKNLAWQRRVATLMSHCIGRPEATGHCVIGLLDELYAAFQYGQIDHSNFKLRMFIDEIMTKLGFSGGGLKVIMAPYGANGLAQEIRISLLSVAENRLVGAYDYPIFAGETSENLLEEISDVFERTNFREIEVVDDVQDVSADSEQEKRYLLSRPGRPSLPTVPFPTSTLYH